MIPPHGNQAHCCGFSQGLDKCKPKAAERKEKLQLRASNCQKEVGKNINKKPAMHKGK